jgi:hypothetical protein
MKHQRIFKTSKKSPGSTKKMTRKKAALAKQQPTKKTAVKRYEKEQPSEFATSPKPAIPSSI